MCKELRKTSPVRVKASKVDKNHVALSVTFLSKQLRRHPTCPILNFTCTTCNFYMTTLGFTL